MGKIIQGVSLDTEVFQKTKRLAKEKNNTKLVQYYSDVNRELSKQASKIVKFKRW